MSSHIPTYFQDPPPPYEEIEAAPESHPRPQQQAQPDQKQRASAEEKTHHVGLRSLDQNCSPFYTRPFNQARNQDSPLFTLIKPSALNCMVIPQSKNSLQTYAWVAVALVVLLIGKSLLS